MISCQTKQTIVARFCGLSELSLVQFDLCQFLIQLTCFHGEKTLYQSHLQFFDSTTVAFIYSQFKNICLFHIFHFFLTPHEEKV